MPVRTAQQPKAHLVLVIQRVLGVRELRPVEGCVVCHRAKYVDATLHRMAQSTEGRTTGRPPADRTRLGTIQYAARLRERAANATGYYDRMHLTYCADVLEKHAGRAPLALVPPERADSAPTQR